jgi:hypothetical protein
LKDAVRGAVLSAIVALPGFGQDAPPPSDPAPTEPAPQPPPAPDVTPGPQAFSFKSPDGHSYDGRIEHPTPDKRNGFAVVLLGGDLANDLDWTIPADSAIDGRPPHDAARLADALVARGYTVMRWETIPTDGDFKAQWPGAVVFNSYPETVDHARAALRAFRELKAVDDANIILLGLGLGATRACQLAETDGPVAGLILLGGELLARTGHEPGERQALADAWIAPADTSQDGKVSAEEFDAAKASDPARPLSDLGFAAIDRDGDGQLSRWEVAAQLINRMRLANDGTVDFDKDWRKYTLSRPEDVIARLGVPVLVVYGGLDEDHAVNGPILEARGTAESWKDVQERYFPAVGHQLGPETSDTPDGATKVGPMPDDVVNAIGEWLEARFHK